MIIREARSEDAGVLAKLHEAAFADGVTRPWSPDEFRSLIASESVLAPMLSIDGDLAAFAVVQVAGDVADLLTVAVSPAQRRRGLGRRILDFTVHDSVRVGAVRMLLEVAENNNAARCLYVTLGFEVIATRRGYYRARSPAIDAIVYQTYLGVSVPH